MSDPTEQIRRELLAEMPAECVAAAERGEPVWTTAEMQAEFEVLGFSAPLVVVRQRASGLVGSLMFTHNPRWYFGWQVTP